MKKIIFNIFQALLFMIILSGCEVAITPLDYDNGNPEVSITPIGDNNVTTNENGVDIVQIANIADQVNVDDIRLELTGEGSENFESTVVLKDNVFIISVAPKEGFTVETTREFKFIARVYILDSPSCTKEISIWLEGTNIPPITNTPPVAKEQNVTLAKDSSITITLVAEDADNDSLTYRLDSNTSHGIVVLNGNMVTYTPNINYIGNDSFTFSVNDGLIDSNSATVNIEVTSTQVIDTIPPVITVTGTDVMIEQNTPYTDEGARATDNVDGNVPVVTSGTVDTATIGSYIITYTAIDTAGNSATATRTVTVVNVNDTPTILGIPAISVNQDSSYSFTPTASDADSSDILTFSITNAPVWASFDTTTGTLSGTPSNSDVGTTTGIVISVSDGTVSAALPAFDITVVNVNDVPSIIGTPAISVNQDASYSFTPTASDADSSDILTFSITNAPVWASFDTTTGTLSGTPRNSDVGTTTGIVISVSDGTVSAALPAFDITVVNVNDAPVAVGDSLDMDEDTDLTYTLQGSDEDVNAILVYTITEEPLNGEITLNNDTIIYTPYADYYGTDGFSYIVTDEHNASSNSARVDINIIDIPEANTPPVAEDINITMDINTSVITIDLNASDSDGDTLTYLIVDPPAFGTLSVISGNQVDYDRGTYTGNTYFTYKVNDGTVDSNVATVTIDSNVPNTPPIAYDQIVSMDEGTSTDIVLNASDPDGDTLSYRIDVMPLYGTVTILGDTATYTPNLNFSGTDSFTFIVNDGVDDSNRASVSVKIGAVNAKQYLFSWCDDENGTELWGTDGSEENTSIVKDIYPAGSSNPTELLEIDGTYFFSADDGVHGVELWKSEGTPGSTVLVKDINDGNQSANPTSFIDINGTLFFVADDGINGKELWKSDGTGLGTVMVANINEAGNSTPAMLTDVEGTLFFTANDGIHGIELWKSDGTEEGTMLVEDMTIEGSTRIVSHTVFNGLFVFSAEVSFWNYQLFSSDGNTITQIGYFETSFEGQAYLTVVKDMLYFSAYDTEHRRELWQSDGTTAEFVADINKDYDSSLLGYLIGNSYPEDLIDVNGTLYFTAIETTDGDRTLWTYDELNGVQNIGGSKSNPKNLININGTLYFSESNNELHKVLTVNDNGTFNAQTVKVFTDADALSDFKNVNGVLYFRVIKNSAPDELWTSESMLATTPHPIATGCTP